MGLHHAHSLEPNKIVAQGPCSKQRLHADPPPVRLHASNNVSFSFPKTYMVLPASQNMIVEPVSLNIQTRRDVNNNQLPKEQSLLDGPAGTKAHDEQTHRGVASTFTKLLVEAFFFPDAKRSFGGTRAGSGSLCHASIERWPHR